MDEKEFYEKYNFDNLKMVTVINPTSDDFDFDITMETSVDISNGQMKSETKHYVVPAGSKERLPGVAANLYLDQIAKKIAQDEDRFSIYPDFAIRAQYYEDLIIEVEDLLKSYQTLPQYNQEDKTTEAPVEEPFASVKETTVEQSEAPAERTASTREEVSRRSTPVDNKKK